MANVELRDEILADGLEYGPQATNGNWRAKKVGTAIVFAVLVGGVFVDKLTITEAGLVTVNDGNINADGATFSGDLVLNSAVQTKLKLGPIGSEHGAKYDAANFYQLWTDLDEDFKICNAEDGTVMFSIDTSANVCSLTNLKFPASPTASADVNTIDAFVETTWTPTLLDSTFTDDAQTYTLQWGKYQRVGSRIDFEGRLEMLDLGTLTGGDTAYIGGLPVASDATAGTEGLVSTGKATNLALTAGDILQGYVEVGQQRILLEKYDATTGTSPVLISEITLDGSFSFKGSYYV